MKAAKSSILLVAKLALVGAIICAVAWSVVVYQPDGSVRESDADILDLNFITLSNSARFARGLKQLGHDEPQTFDINGNIINFSVNSSRKRPAQLMREYQEEFVYQGLNKKVWPPHDPAGEADDFDMILEGMTGGVIPLRVTDNMVAMGGVVPANGATDEEGLKDLASSKDPKDRKIYKGHHFVEMFWDDETRRSRITASWSDENFDYRKMRTEPSPDGLPQTGISVDVEVPACPGCTRISRVRDLDPTRTHSTNIFAADRPQQDLLDFYRRAMVGRGWAETESSATFNAAKPYIDFQGAEANILQFARGDQFLTILGFPSDDGEMMIHTTMSN